MVSPQVRREAVDALMSERGFGVTRACGLVRISQSLYRYRSKRPECAELKARISEIAEAKRRYGYRRIYVRLRREGWQVNRKRVYRLYREAGLLVRRRKRKRIGLADHRGLARRVQHRAHPQLTRRSDARRVRRRMFSKTERRSIFKRRL